ncbi:hypothetical protein LguiB_002422 [Lonicera macranthoides]
MSSTSKAWIVAASVGAVEALKDQGFCRWNYTLRTLHQHAKNNLSRRSSLSQYSTKNKKISAHSSAMVVGTSVGAVEALKHQGFCRWNYTLRSLHQHAKNNLSLRSSLSHNSNKNKKTSPHTCSAMVVGSNNKRMKQSEESLRTVMYLSCWAASVGAVEALKDQGFCRWNHTLRSLHQHVKNNINLRSLSQSKKKISPHSSAIVAGSNTKIKQSEESLRTTQVSNGGNSYLNRVWMAATVAVVNGHTDQPHKLRSGLRSLHHGKKRFSSTSGTGVDPVDLRPLYGVLESD